MKLFSILTLITFSVLTAPNGHSTQVITPTDGFVFERTDKAEVRYVVGANNIWIDADCAAQLGGATQFGTWSDLNTIAPNFDSIAYPCDETARPSTNQGFIFVRTDVDELRYVMGEGNIWIDIDCAIYLIEHASLTEEDIQFGTWSDLNAIAPNFDSISSPCSDITRPSSSQGYVYARTDVEEYRYVIGTGNIWIDSECANSLGGPTEYGTWFDLNDIAPNFDSIGNPCTGLRDDANGDGIIDFLDGDFNGDGAVDEFDLDFNGDGFVDTADDYNGDGFNDFLDFDINGDGFTDSLDDSNGDGVINISDVMAEI